MNYEHFRNKFNKRGLTKKWLSLYAGRHSNNKMLKVFDI